MLRRIGRITKPIRKSSGLERVTLASAMPLGDLALDAECIDGHTLG